MSSRLQLKHGLVAERDRLSTSADSLLVSEPSTGSKTRTKGNLYVLVSSAMAGGRARDAAAVAAQTIQREYYYDESAGIPILLEKCFRSANRKLRGRDGSGIQPGSVGIAVAVIRGNELYVATIGAVDAYLVRAARLLVPEHTAAEGIPAAEIRVDVWRGELSVGDTILLVSRKLTEAVGTEELKNAVVTLHPQSAVEHLHHLFVASGGEGSDAVLVVEASDVYGRADGRTPQAAHNGDAFGELAAGTQAEIAGSPPRSGPAAAVAGGRGLVAGITAAIGNAVDRLPDLVPRRSASPRGFTPQVSRREAQRRGAIAILAFLVVILVVGVGVAVFPRLQEHTSTDIGDAQSSFNSAKDKTDQALGPGGVPAVASERAIQLLRDAYADLKRAETGGATVGVADLRARITAGLDLLYNVHHAKATQLVSFGVAAQPTALEHGPIQDPRALYFIDQKASTVSRVDPHATSPIAKVVVKAGDGAGAGIGAPRFLTAGGLDLLIVDARGELWSWRPSNKQGDGTLRKVLVRGDQVWGPNGVTDIATYPAGSERYGIYVVLPAAKQILKYSQFGDGSALSPPTNWLTGTSDDVAQFMAMSIDFYMYTIVAAVGSCDTTCVGDKVVQHSGGNLTSGYGVDALPDQGDLRPGHDYQMIVGTGDRSSGRLYLYDTIHDRVVVFNKSGGTYVEQWLTVTSGQAMSDVTGILAVAPTDTASTDPTVLYWLTAKGLMSSPLTNIDETPGASPSIGPVPSPSGPAASPTKKPRKTP